MNVVFFGTPEFAVPSLERLIASRHEVLLVVAQPDRPAGRGMRLHKPPVAELALAHGIPVEQPSRIRTDEFLDTVGARSPDLGVVVAYGKILPPKLLAIPKHGFVNVHASLLPQYRGAAPIQRAIAAGDEQTGVSIMQVDEEMDHGPVFATRTTPIEPNERTPSLAARLAAIGADALIEVIDAIERGEARPEKQDHARATHAPKIEKKEGEVDWNRGAAEIYDRFRAFHPWPGLSTAMRGETVKIVDMHLDHDHGGEGTDPGTILAIEPPAIFVACGSWALKIDAMQRAGKGPVPASDLARAFGLTVGSPLR